VVTSHLAAGATVVVTSDGVVSDGVLARVSRPRGDLVRRRAVLVPAPAPPRARSPRAVELAHADPGRRRHDPALVAQYHAIGAARGGGLHVMYGQTEACARIAVLPPSELPARAGAVGRAVADTAIAIEHDGVAVAPGEIGEVIVRGPGVMLGYADTRDDLARGDEQGGVLATGDLGRLDADGVLWLTGRTRRFAKVFGVRVSLDDIEALAAAALTTAPPLAAVAAGERIKLVIEGEVDAAALGRALAERTGLHPSGFAVVTVAALPRLATGKPDYPRIEAA
jgi:acyl-CoA synthetase (AMP-forming)/AMP-acid ligase II